MSRSIWATLGVRAGSDRDTIRRAYAAKLRETNPEDNPEGFMALRAAYEAALQRAGRVPEPVSATPRLDGDADEPALHVEQDAPQALHVEHEPEPRDAELEDLQQRWDALASSLEHRWGADPALLRALLAAPALERITVRAEIEGHVAALIADHIPKSDTLVMPAIRAFGWGDLALARTSYAVRTVLDRAAELPHGEGEVTEAPAKGFFNRLSKWQGGGIRIWVFAGILLVNVLRLAFSDPAPEPDHQLRVEQAGAPSGLLPPKPLPPDAGRWLTPADRIADGGSDAATVKITLAIEFDGDGRVTHCNVNSSEPRSTLGDPTCRLVERRARIGPDLRRRADGNTLDMIAIWGRREGSSYVPLRLAEEVLADSGNARSADATRAAVPPIADPVRRGPECPADPPQARARPPKPCSPMESWLTTADFPRDALLAAGTRRLSAVYEVGLDGYVSGCRVEKPSGVAEVDGQVCRLLTERVHYLPGRRGDGRAARWQDGLDWGWTIKRAAADPPAIAPPLVPKAEFDSTATDAPIGQDVPAK